MKDKLMQDECPETIIEQCLPLGFFRLQIVNENTDGKIVGDSGWCKNLVTNTGFQHYLVELMGASTGSSRITHAALGTGGAPTVAQTVLAGEQSVRKSVTFSEVGSKTAQFVATFASADSFVTATKNISNIGLFATSTQGTGSIFAGNTYASSSFATKRT